MWIDAALKRNLIPDFLVRMQIRRLLRQRLSEKVNYKEEDLIQEMKSSPLALHPKAANEQHYEVPTEFYLKVLGPNLKYSSALFLKNSDTLEIAEQQMLDLTCERAQLKNGQKILELGCGWGSLTLWMAKKYPQSRILSISNSKLQREFIQQKAKSLNIQNVEVRTVDMNDLFLQETFDRIVSVEMFEHMRNIEALFNKISHWLNEDGRVFAHIFSNREFAYFFENRDSTDWMSKYFFTGGMMPSHNLYRKFDQKLVIEEDWEVSGKHYQQTAEEWLSNLDREKAHVLDIFERFYGKKSAALWVSRWRVFFMACAELWGFAGGREWMVSHYRFRKRVP